MNLISSETITAPGLYRMSAEAYHRDPTPEPSLSSHIARLMLRSPAHAFMAHPRLNPDFKPDDDTKFDFGSCAHKLLLGLGAEIDVCDYENWRTKESQERRKKAAEEGRIPILAADYAKANAMAECFHAQIEAHGLDELWLVGSPEVVIAWREGDVWCRSMVDMLHVTNSRAYLFDFKSSAGSAAPAVAARRIFDFGYDLQLAFYLRGLRAVLPGTREIAAYIVMQEKEPPYALSVTDLSYEAMRSANEKVEYAIAKWRDCMASNRWPAYPPRVSTAAPPPWHEQAWIEQQSNDALLRDVGIDPNIMFAG